MRAFSQFRACLETALLRIVFFIAALIWPPHELMESE